MKYFLAILVVLGMCGALYADNVVYITPTNIIEVSQVMVPSTVTQSVDIIGFDIMDVRYNISDSSWDVVASVLGSSSNRVRNCKVSVSTNDIMAANDGASVGSLTVSVLNSTVISIGIQKALDLLTIHSTPSVTRHH